MKKSASKGGSTRKMRTKKTSRFRIMQPAPRQKPPQISPIFIADKVSLAVSREKDGKLHLVDAGWDDTKVVPPDGCGPARRGVEGRNLPPPTKR
jgi:hypothetical protein